MKELPRLDGYKGLQFAKAQDEWGILSQFLDKEYADELAKDNRVHVMSALGNALTQPGNLELKRALMANIMHLGSNGQVELDPRYAQLGRIRDLWYYLPKETIEDKVQGALPKDGVQAVVSHDWVHPFVSSWHPNAAMLRLDLASPEDVQKLWEKHFQDQVGVDTRGSTAKPVSTRTTAQADRYSYLVPALLAGAPIALLGGALGGHRVGFGALAAAGLAGLGYGMYREHTGKGFEPIDNWVNGLRSELKLAPLEAPKAPTTAGSGSPAR